MSEPPSPQIDKVAEQNAKLKMFTFYVRNDKTNEIASFSGQGETMDSAWKDAGKNLDSAWRPNSNGEHNEHTNVIPRLNVRTPEGKIVFRQKSNFEGETPHKEGEK